MLSSSFKNMEKSYGGVHIKVGIEDELIFKIIQTFIIAYFLCRSFLVFLFWSFFQCDLHLARVCEMKSNALYVS